MESLRCYVNANAERRGDQGVLAVEIPFGRQKMSYPSERN